MSEILLLLMMLCGLVLSTGYGVILLANWGIRINRDVKDLHAVASMLRRRIDATEATPDLSKDRIDSISTRLEAIESRPVLVAMTPAETKDWPRLRLLANAIGKPGGSSSEGD